MDDGSLTTEELRARFDALMERGEPVEIAPGPKPVGIFHQCFADIQSAHPREPYEYVVSSIYFDPDNDLVGQLIVVEDFDADGPTCVGRVIKQDQGLIEVAIRL